MNNTHEIQKSGFKNRAAYLFPPIINIEVYRGTCPCRCVHCPVGLVLPKNRRSRFGKKGIDLKLYKKILNEISQYSHAAVRLHSVGEPLDWDEIESALRMHNENIKSWLFTSAVTDKKKLLESVCENISIVEISVNSTTSHDYLKTKGVNAFEKVCRNIEYMRRYIERSKINTRLIVSRVQSLDKIADNKFVQYWRSTGLVDDAFVRTFHTYNELIPNCDNNQEKDHHACLVHWARFNISVEGYAVICFNELFKERLNPEIIYGDLKFMSIKAIWHGQKLNTIRKAELNGNYSTVADAFELPCRHCTSCQPLLGDNQTSEYQINLIGEDVA